MSGAANSSEFDVVVLGEPMIELHRDAQGRPTAPDAVSGDAYNAACAAALAGARVTLLTVLGQDEAGDAVIADLQSRGVGVRQIQRATQATGSYTISPGIDGAPVFTYQRAGSAASTLGPAHLAGWVAVLDATKVLVTSGITGALSDTASTLVAAAAARVAAAGGTVCYDVNFRAALTDAGRASRLLGDVVPHARLVKIASPGDSKPLLGVTDPAQVTAALRQLTDAAVLVTRGADPLELTDGVTTTTRSVTRMPDAVDATGAGDALLGTLAAALSRGDTPSGAVPMAMAAAALSTQHPGGAPRASLQEIRRLLPVSPT